MTVELPAPAEVLEAATKTATPGSGAALNVVVSGSPPSTVTRDDGAYHGTGAGSLGRLAATVSAIENLSTVCLHPTPDYTVEGPWLVIEPLAGRLATVAKGTGTVTLTLEAPSGFLDARLRNVRNNIDAVLEAARPTHERYPVERDEFEAFTPGLTTYTLQSVSLDGPFEIILDIATTPTTTEPTVRDRFTSIDGVTSVDVSFDHGVERATPPEWLQFAAEASLDTVLGDWTYEWLPGPTLFNRVPASAKLAIGTGTPAATEFTTDEYETLHSILTQLFSEVESHQ